MTLRTCDSSVPTSAAICCGFILVADAQQINARSRLTSDAALRESRLSRLPSSGNSSLTNTDGGRITTSKLRMRPSSPTSHDFRSTDTRRATSPRELSRGAERELLAQRALVARAVVNDGDHTDPHAPFVPHQAACAPHQAELHALGLPCRDLERRTTNGP